MWFRREWLLAMLAVFGCRTPTGFEKVRVPGYLILDRSGPDVTVEAVDEGVAVRITTYGNGCFTADGSEVQVDKGKVTVKPFDVYVVTPQQICPDVLRAFRHDVDVSITVPRPWTVSVVGRARPGDKPIIIERIVK